MKFSLRKYNCIVIIITYIFIFLLSVHAFSRESSLPDFYYFNPDSSQANLSRLKFEMDSFLSNVNYAINFQPFARLVDFDQKLKEKRPAFLLLPEWYRQRYGDLLKLKPFMVPLRKGFSSYQKVLLAAKNSHISLKNIKNHSLAMTYMGPDGEDILNKILFSKLDLNANELDIVIVPKDSDALFALALGQVDMAFIVQDTMDHIKAINSKIVESVYLLAESDPIPMPIMCYCEESASYNDREKLKQIFLNNIHKDNNTRIMKMLNIDAWKIHSVHLEKRINTTAK